MISTSSNKLGRLIQKLLESIYHDTPNVKVISIDSMPLSSHKTYVLTTSLGYFVLKTSPSSGTKLMKYESKCPSSSESQILRVIAMNTSIPIPTYIASCHCKFRDTSPLGDGYLLRSYIPGVTLPTISHRLVAHESTQINTNIGSYMKLAIQHTMPRFGTNLKVRDGKGFSTWREAFEVMINQMIRDAEDLLLTLPYESIRYWLAMNSRHLDVVKISRLCPLRAGSAETVIVDQSTKIVAGIIGWADVVWGDPLLGKVFDEATDSFWIGFGCRKQVEYDDGFDDIRRKIYSVYHCIVALVKNHIRPEAETNDLEIRRKLNRLLSDI